MTGVLVDLLRIVLVCLPAAALFGITLVIIVRYYQAYRAARRAVGATTGEFGWRGLLPRHVWQIGVSYLLFAGACIRHVLGEFHEPFHWHAVFVGGASILGVRALWDVLGHERRVHDAHRG